MLHTGPLKRGHFGFCILISKLRVNTDIMFKAATVSQDGSHTAVECPRDDLILHVVAQQL